MIVDFENLAAKRGAPAILDGLLGDECLWKGVNDRSVVAPQVGEIAADEGLTHQLTVGRDGDEELETISETREYLAEVRNANLATDGRGAVGFGRQPESVTGEIAEPQIGVVLVVVFPNESEAAGEGLTEGLAPWNVIWCRQPVVDEVEGGEEHQWLVRALMLLSTDANQPNVELVKTFDGRS